MEFERVIIRKRVTEEPCSRDRLDQFILQIAHPNESEFRRLRDDTSGRANFYRPFVGYQLAHVCMGLKMSDPFCDFPGHIGVLVMTALYHHPLSPFIRSKQALIADDLSAAPRAQ